SSDTKYHRNFRVIKNCACYPHKPPRKDPLDFSNFTTTFDVAARNQPAVGTGASQTSGPRAHPPQKSCPLSFNCEWSAFLGRGLINAQPRARPDSAGQAARSRRRGDRVRRREFITLVGGAARLSF